MNLFYVPEISAESREITLSEDESKHACRVLRLRTGDKVILLDGRGGTYTAEIIEDHPKHCTLHILDYQFEEMPVKEIHVAIAPTKNNERIEWFLEKATELGITEVTLLLCGNSERKQIKEDRFEKILVSAMKQSQRKYLPKLHSLTPFKTFISEHPKGALAHCYDGEKSLLQDVFQASGYPLLIGPEGDFTPEEVALAQQSGYDSISLGKNRLRTETAGLYVCMIAVMH